MNLLELVPYSLDQIVREAETCLEKYTQLSGINIPDVLRIPIRSLDAAQVLLNRKIMAIPHIRAMDFEISEVVDRIGELKEIGLTHVLIVSGDVPQDPTRKVYSVTPIQLISALRAQFPALRIFGALDPYRTTQEKELAYANDKLAHGADGLFTQPFFCEKEAQDYGEKLSNSELFFGVSPVLTDSSKKYWEEKNNVVFNDAFETTLEYNCRISKNILTVAKSMNQHSYIMPIKAPLDEYLSGMFKE